MKSLVSFGLSCMKKCISLKARVPQFKDSSLRAAQRSQDPQKEQQVYITGCNVCSLKDTRINQPHLLNMLFSLLSIYSQILFFFNKFIYLIYLFLAALGFRCCARAFSSCSERGLLFVAVCRLLIAVASLVAEHRL